MTLAWFTDLVDSYRLIAPDTIGQPGYSAETRFDPYYVSMTGFVSLVILAILDVVGIFIPESFYHPRFRN